MKYPEYAASRGLTEEAVKDALAALGKSVHPNHHVDEAALDAHLKVGPGAPDPDASIENVHGEQNGTLPGPVQAEATPAEVQPEPEPPVEPEPVDDTPRPEREPTLADPNVDRKGAQQELAAREIPDSQKPKSQRVPTQQVLGRRERGSKVFEITILGGKSPIPVGTYRAFGLDESEAIGAVVSRYGIKDASTMNFRVKPANTQRLD